MQQICLSAKVGQPAPPVILVAVLVRRQPKPYSVDVAVDECGQSSTHSVGRTAAAAHIVDADPQ